MSGSSLSESEIRECVYGFCQALAARNLEKIQSMIAEDASVSWGPYNFKGKNEILTWAIELHELFPFMTFKENSLEVSVESAKHDFLIAFLTAQSQRGWLPIHGTYTFKDGQIIRFDAELLHGFLSIKKTEIERVKPHSTA
jgi:ketosteroid isomerase-like protein